MNKILNSDQLLKIIGGMEVNEDYKVNQPPKREPVTFPQQPVIQTG